MVSAKSGIADSVGKPSPQAWLVGGRTQRKSTQTTTFYKMTFPLLRLRSQFTPLSSYKKIVTCVDVLGHRTKSCLDDTIFRRTVERTPTLDNAVLDALGDAARLNVGRYFDWTSKDRRRPGKNR